MSGALSHAERTSSGIRLKANEIILGNKGIIIQLLMRRHHHAIMRARDLGRVDGRNDSLLAEAAMCDAWPQLLSSTVAYLKTGRKAGASAGTYLGWGLQAWQTSVFDEVKKVEAKFAGWGSKPPKLPAPIAIDEELPKLEEAGLDGREIDVIFRLARGQTLKRIAREKQWGVWFTRIVRKSAIEKLKAYIEEQRRCELKEAES